MSCTIAPRLAPRRWHRLYLIGALAAGCHSGAHAPASGAGARADASEPSYLVVYRPGPRWPEGDAMPAELRDHFRYLIGLHEAGKLQLAGPFASEPGGAALLHAPDDDAARALIQADPAVTAQVFAVELRRWSLVDWSAQAQRLADRASE